MVLGRFVYNNHRWRGRPYVSGRTYRNFDLLVQGDRLRLQTCFSLLTPRHSYRKCSTALRIHYSSNSHNRRGPVNQPHLPCLRRNISSLVSMVLRWNLFSSDTRSDFIILRNLAFPRTPILLLSVWLCLFARFSLLARRYSKCQS